MTTQTSISLTDRAADKLKELQLCGQIKERALRFGTKLGFCGQGYEYTMDVASAPQADEQVFYSHGIAIFVSGSSMPRLSGAVIDFHMHEHAESVDDRLDIFQKLGFTVENPNAKGPCPCMCNKGFDC